MKRLELTGFAASCGSSHTHALPRLSRPGRDVAVLAGLQIVCFLALTQLEPRFFMIHLYQAIPYLAIMLLVGYGQARWAYMAGPLVSLGWLALASMAGLLGSAVEHLRSFGSFGVDANLVTLLAILTACLAVLMITLCRIHWVKGYSAGEKVWRMFFVSLGMVVAYYVILLRWFWDLIPGA